MGRVSTDDDELRPVTALFADLVGSTGLGETLAPGEVKALVGECVTRMSRAVEEFGGNVQAYMGDGICAYFGVPAAHEDDPERAARAALRIVQLVGEYAKEVEAAWGITGFSVRIGVNSGQAAVGLVGAAAPQEVALGDATNVAARLQAAAEPGTIVVGGATAARIAKEFVLEPLGELAVKGRAEAVTAWKLVRPQSGTRAAPSMPLVGREAELARLREALEELVAGRGQVVVVVGESGLGATRLLEELRMLAEGRATWLEAGCPSFGSELVYWPLEVILRRWLGVEEGEPAIAVRTKARARLGEVLGERAEAVLPYLGPLLAVTLDLGAGGSELSPEALIAGLHRAYRDWVLALAEQGPLVLALEDVHWADPSSCELISELLEVTDRAPLLLALTTRPEPASEGWKLRLKVETDYAHRLTEVALRPLSERAQRAYLRLLMPALDESVVVELVERAEGNPRYLEELLRFLVEGGGLLRERTWTLSMNAADLLPPALENLLVARIDRLPETARKVAQTAAVIGRTFPVRLLERVVWTDDLDRDLATLFRAEIVRELRRYPELECTFKHGLLQEAALSTLTPERRREFHGRVGDALEELYGDALDDHLELLAHHFGRSDQLEKAFSYLVRAAVRAEELGAGPQAAELRRRADKVKVRLGRAP
jgi:class 3 adenylate cyclase